VAVRVGVSEGGMTEIIGGDLSEGDTVVVGDDRAKKLGLWARVTGGVSRSDQIGVRRGSG